MKSKAQALSFFLLAAVALLVLFVFVYYVVTIDARGGIVISFERDSIQSYIERCLQTTTEDGLAMLGKQGGRIFSQDFTQTPNYGVEIHLKNNNIRSPTKQEMELDLERYIDANLLLCLEDFKAFERQGWQVQTSDKEINVDLGPDDVITTLNQDIQVSNEARSISFQIVETRTKTRLLQITQAVSQMLTTMSQNNGQLPLTLLNNQPFDVIVFPYNDALLIRFLDREVGIKQGPYQFTLSVKPN